MTVKDYL